MIHQPSGGAEGQSVDMEIRTNRIVQMRERLNKILAKNTGQKIAKIEKDTDRDNFMLAAEAVKYGLVDKIVS